MSEPIISVRGLGKRYKLGATIQYDTLRDRLTHGVKGLFSSKNGSEAPKAYTKDPDKREFWALKDVSFDVNEGEVVGIIGRNGAGKSTLLKVLSEITDPTTGEIHIRGRVSSLLEVGTGFHPELSGRENIFLNGAILGMSRAEIRRKFDEIVAFAEVEKFLDTPVKRYSSGMYVRLAFAVAAHLEPEILLVDEVLAVGDVGFQRKCLGKMEEIASSGRTVLFVSHNMGTIETLTQRAVCLEKGTVLIQGDARKAVREYLDFIERNVLGAQGEEKMLRINLLSEGAPATALRMGEPLVFEIHYDLPHPIRRPMIGIGITNEQNVRAFSLSMWYDGVRLEELSGKGKIICNAGNVPLNQGAYMVKLVLQQDVKDVEVSDPALRFEIVPTDVFGNGQIPTRNQGLFYCSADWTKA
jgi:lipopolysaccharide transport system ATP-binding protein